MKLKSFGCSFIFGTDLPNDGRYTPIATPSDHAYPVLIAKRQGLDWSCHARPGAGNFEILHQIVDQVATQEPAIFVINWTWIDRFSYVSEDPIYRKHPMNPLGWRSIMPVDDTPVSQFYYKNLHSQLRDKVETLLCIKSAIDLLKTGHFQFIMTWTDSLLWEKEWHCPPTVNFLQDQIKPYLSDFDGVNFLDWSRRQGLAISPTSHPLETAHQAAADYLMDRWDSVIRSQ